MPDAIAEPPVADIAQAREPISFNMSEALARISKDRIKGTQEAKKEEPVAEKKEEPVVEKKEEPKTEPVVEKKEEPKVEEKKADPEIKHNAGHFKVVTDARDAAIAEAAKLKLELETARRTAPEDVQQKLSDYEKQLDEVRKSEAELRAKVREVDVTLDPAFEKEFTMPMVKARNEVYELLIRGGASKEDAKVAVESWDDGKFAEVTAEMGDIQKRRVDAAILETERLHKVRAEQIKSPEDFAARRRMEADAQQQQAVKHRQSVADKIYRGALESTPVLAEEGNAQFRDAMQQQLSRAVKGEMPMEEVLMRVAGYEAMQLGLQGQHAVLVEQDAKIKELEKKLAEQDKFIAGGALPKGEAAGGGEGEYVPLVKSLRVA